MVFFGLPAAGRRAPSPTRRSPLLENATTEGVVRKPSAFGITFGSPPSMTATHELVVPRSIPMTFPMVFISSFLRQVGRALTALRPNPQELKYARCRGVEPHIGEGVTPARTLHNRSSGNA